ncbi:MAG: hypothetical protein J0M11_14665 [Anaerolineae bacterium]|nr:hypothetical protein [Anaerolineae bacterium]
MTESFPCTACGGPNEAIAGESQMACTYCGANLSIPKELRVKAKPAARVTTPRAKPTIRLEKEAPDLLRKAQPVITKAWNSYVYWTWLRWLLPTCLMLVVVGFVICSVLGVLPFFLFQ